MTKHNHSHLSPTPFNRFGYDIDFYHKGQYDGSAINYVALSAHIVALDKESKELGFDI